MKSLIESLLDIEDNIDNVEDTIKANQLVKDLENKKDFEKTIDDFIKDMRKSGLKKESGDIRRLMNINKNCYIQVTKKLRGEIYQYTRIIFINSNRMWGGITLCTNLDWGESNVVYTNSFDNSISTLGLGKHPYENYIRYENYKVPSNKNKFIDYIIELIRKNHKK